MESDVIFSEGIVYMSLFKIIRALCSFVAQQPKVDSFCWNHSTFESPSMDFVWDFCLCLLIQFKLWNARFPSRNFVNLNLRKCHSDSVVIEWTYMKSMKERLMDGFKLRRFVSGVKYLKFVEFILSIFTRKLVLSSVTLCWKIRTIVS